MPERIFFSQSIDVEDEPDLKARAAEYIARVAGEKKWSDVNITAGKQRMYSTHYVVSYTDEGIAKQAFLKQEQVLPKKGTSFVRSVDHYRFEHEVLGRLARGNEHHVAQLIDAQLTDDDSFLLMEWYPVTDVSERVEKGEYSRRDILRLLSQIGSVLIEIEEAGLVLRDLNPDSILQDPEGNFYLTDFGNIAPGDGFADTEYDAISREYCALGYGAPEAHFGDNNDAISTVYSFAQIMYRVVTQGWYSFNLTTDQPKAGATALQILLERRGREKSLGTYQFLSGLLSGSSPDLGEVDTFADELSAVLIRGLEVSRDPQAKYHRFQTMAEFIATLTAVLGSCSYETFEAFQRAIKDSPARASQIASATAPNVSL